MVNRSRAADPRIPLLIDQLDRAYRGPSWHGTSLRGTLRGLTTELALWRPGPDRNSIWQLVLHAAYWKYTVRRKLSGAARGSFPRAGADFPLLPSPPDDAGWKADLQLLDDEHAALRTAVEAITPGRLLDRRGAWRLVDFVSGAAAHDLYHAGQINLLKKLLK
ncbi:MAG: DinB family protein [Planctomycetes bacterium]|nr:DinB family protein [Planctomycetota bacterium]